ncbi:hypothetical protein CT138_07930 [Mannheimia varigena]|nr:hypothetical protein CT138_07930 [Mannheimia varigena]
MCEFEPRPEHHLTTKLNKKARKINLFGLFCYRNKQKKRFLSKILVAHLVTYLAYYRMPIQEKASYSREQPYQVTCI